METVPRTARALARLVRQASTRPPRDALATVVVHADAHFDAGARGGGHALDIAPPIGVSTTFASADGGPVYSRSSAPTRERCEEVLAAIEAADDLSGGCTVRALLYSSGAAATHAALHYLLGEADATRLRISGGYHGTHQVAAQLQLMRASLRIEPLPTEPELERWLDGQPRASAGGALGGRDGDAGTPPVESGDILWLETPKNPSCEVADVALYARAARAASTSTGRAFVVVDSTFAPPPVQRGLLVLGATLVMHSSTKGLAGHSDALGGALLVAEGKGAATPAGAYAALRAQRTALGAVPGSLEAWLLLRSLRTLDVRARRQCASALALARWLSGEAAPAPRGEENANEEALLARALRCVHAVHYPLLASCVGHEAARRQMALGGSVLALELHSAQAAQALPAQLRLFRDATSLGGVESLAEWRHKYDPIVSPRLVRLSVGVEDARDLCTDLARAIVRASEGVGAG
ncbi:hypothetical protein KFE25_000549 [Diacronema lutheri]|uniref:Cystathionine gamma-synthase n=1 Tax=Diacronema lutheri TaxID=2081491 RepID=A0A8J5XLT9_DIALT|nr:hypothetical protein KFE25_000549 [Diacronema lutheri]